VIERPVHELMQAAPAVVAPTTTVKDLVHLLATQRIDAVPVVEDGRLAGIVSAQDLLYLEVEADEEGPLAGTFLDFIVDVQRLASWQRHLEKAFAVTVSDLMTDRDVRTASPDETVHEAAKRMAEEGVAQLPVVDADGRVVGLLDRVDVVVALDRFEYGGDQP
jgi:CBS domain-containing protein